MDSIQTGPGNEQPMTGKLLSVGDMLERVFSFYGKNWSTFVLLGLVPLAFELIISYIGYLYIPNEVTGTLNLNILSIASVTLLVGFVITSLHVIAVMRFVSSDPLEHSFDRLYRFAVKSLLPIWWIWLLFYLTIFGGFVMLIIPGLYFLVMFSFSQFVRITEGYTGFKALERSYALATGKFWGIVGRTLLLVLITGTALSVISGLLQSVTKLGLQGVFEPVSHMIPAALSYMVIVPLNLILIYVLYRSADQVTPLTEKAPANAFARAALIVGSVVTVLLIVFLILFGTVYRTQALDAFERMKLYFDSGQWERETDFPGRIPQFETI